MFFRRAVLILALLAVASSSALSASIVMGRYGPEQTSYTMDKLDLPLSLSWEFTANKYDNNPAAPVVADGVCYFACGDRVYAVDMETGTQKWKYPSDVGLGGSIKGTPAVANGMVFFGSGDGKLYCLSAANGTFQWAYQTRGAIRCPPVIADGIVYFGTDDNSVYGINAETGDSVWAKPFVTRDDVAIGLAVGMGMVVVSCMDGNLYGINASNGKGPHWIFRLPMAPVNSSPIIVSNNVIMAVGNMMYGISARSGQLRWSVMLAAEVAATPAVNGNDIYVPCKDKKIYAYNKASRTPVLKWTEPAEVNATVMSSPVITDNALYVTASKGIVIAISPDDGSTKWRYAVPPSATNTPGALYTDVACSPAIAEDALVILSDDGVAHCFKPNAPDYEAPQSYNEKPAAGTILSGAPPVKISAILFDGGSGLDFSNVALYLDGQPVEFDVDYMTSTISYATTVGGVGKVATNLENGMHKVTVVAKDYKGNVLNKDWYFLVDKSLVPPKTTITEEGPVKKTKRGRGRSDSSTTPPWMPGQNNNNNNNNNGQSGGNNSSMPPPPPTPGGGSEGPGGGGMPLGPGASTGSHLAQGNTLPNSVS